MGWQTVENASLVASAALSFACAAIGFRVVASPYFRGYAAAAAGSFVVSRLAAARR